MLTARAQGWDAVAEKATLPEDVRRKVVNALELVVADNQQIIELRVLRHRGSQQPKPAGRRQAFLDRRDESVIE